ncbi:hypothetical protein R84B8_02091 [Treponema sp. R8-4-B8]
MAVFSQGVIGDLFFLVTEFGKAVLFTLAVCVFRSACCYATRRVGQTTPFCGGVEAVAGMDAAVSEKKGKHGCLPFFLPYSTRPTGVGCSPPLSRLIVSFAPVA